MLEPRPIYNLEVETIVEVNPTPEDITQTCADLETEIMPCSEEL